MTRKAHQLLNTAPSEPTQPQSADDLADLEFFDPQLGLAVEPYIAAESQQGIHHLGRYHWAKDVLRDRAHSRILDVACGAGYGTFILAEHLSSATVLGVDYDARAVEAARARYSRHNLQFQQGNLVTWTTADTEQPRTLGQFDAVVSFDTLEHLLHREIALMQIVRNLSPDGALLFSTPCTFHNKLFPDWAHHKIEYSFDDLRDLLGRFFGQVLTPDEGTLPNLRFWTDVINKDKPRYWNKMNPLVCLQPIR